ncbi:hypothetical protein ACFZCG_25085 [Streptomyces tanashiensis]|uniref:hypothetical protein n=1 Tax=Streptomyces tanashiensis TaxID=67367 RepID=UPI0036EEFBFF
MSTERRGCPEAGHRPRERRVGAPSVPLEVLFRDYAKFLDGVREQANRLIERSMEEWNRVSRGEATR